MYTAGNCLYFRAIAREPVGKPSRFILVTPYTIMFLSKKTEYYSFCSIDYGKKFPISVTIRFTLTFDNKQLVIYHNTLEQPIGKIWVWIPLTRQYTSIQVLCREHPPKNTFLVLIVGEIMSHYTAATPCIKQYGD